MNPKNYIKGRGAQQNTDNRFLQHSFELRDDFLEFCRLEGEEAERKKGTEHTNYNTRIFEVDSRGCVFAPPLRIAMRA